MSDLFDSAHHSMPASLLSAGFAHRRILSRVGITVRLCMFVTWMTGCLAKAQLPLDLREMYPQQNGEVAPPSGFAGTRTTWLEGDAAHFRYQGADGSLEYEWRRPQTAADGPFGVLTLTAQMTGAVSPVTVTAGVDAALNWAQPATAQASTWETATDACTLVRTYALGTTVATVRYTARLVNKSLVLAVTCDQPFVRSFNPGNWGGKVRRAVTVPYYSGTVNYLPNENLMTNLFLDWTASSASGHGASIASYYTRTDGMRLHLSERVIFAASWHLAEVLPNCPNPPSPWRSFLADKIALSFGGRQFDKIAKSFEMLADYGIESLTAILHLWQRSGYDNALPAHFPAQAAYGGDVGMNLVSTTARRNGIRWGLHENYSDYYPNYDFFDPADIALDSDGKPINAWFNTTTQIQSFAIQPNAILRLAATQSPEIHRRYGTNACYIDVISCGAPWSRVDARASEVGAGTFARAWDVHRRLFAYERDTHEGPVFGEGGKHWYWSGMLDGVAAQLRDGWPMCHGLDAPLLVDFDLLRIHPLQFNQGMGFYDGWWPEESYLNEWRFPPPMTVLDRYRMQEVAYGHAGFLGNGADSRTLHLAWLEHHLLSPVTARYATARPVEILYESGGSWIDATANAKLDTPLATRVRIRYDNGLMVTANSASTPLVAGSWLLPPLGWIAEGAGVTAGTVTKQGVVCDFADTGDRFFANARSVVDWNLSTFRRIQPSVASWQQTAARTFQVAYLWDVQERLGPNLQCFVHFVADDAILWQQGHAITPPTSQWVPGQAITDGPYTITIPKTIADGDYRWLIGLFDLAGDFERLKLRGVDDGQDRILLGVLQVRNGGSSLNFVPETRTAPDLPATDLDRLNLTDSVIDFGAVRTNGSVRLRREGSEWALKVWPRNRAFTLGLEANRFPRPFAVRGTANPGTDLVPIPDGAYWRLPLDGSGEYRWAANPVPPRLVNLSVLTSLTSAGDSFTLGYVVGGSGTSGTKPLVIRAAGPSLGALGVAGTLDDPKMDLFAGPTKTGENDNWGGSVTLANSMAAVGAFALSGPTSRDAAAALSVQSGDNSVKISAVGNGTGTVIAEIYDATPAASFSSTTPRLVNVSVLKQLGTGFTAGFVIGGNGTKNVLVRAIGPTLASAFGVTGTVGDPRLTINSGQTVVASNDNWGGAATLSSAFSSVGAFAMPAASRDAAVVASLNPGSYTVQVSDVSGATGLILVEIYELP